jgi:F-type H+-transporting ATPase subunit epsilon
MADNLFAIELVTPERILITGAAAEVILRTGEGDVTFLAGHTPLVGTIEPGVVRVVRAEGDEEHLAVHGGFVQVEQGVSPDESDSLLESAAGATSGTRVTMLVPVAELVEEIDAERARVALERAEAQVAELVSAGRTTGSGAGEDDVPDAEMVEAEAALRRAQVRLEAVDASAGVGTGAAG